MCFILPPSGKLFGYPAPEAWDLGAKSQKLRSLPTARISAFPPTLTGSLAFGWVSPYNNKWIRNQGLFLMIIAYSIYCCLFLFISFVFKRIYQSKNLFKSSISFENLFFLMISKNLSKTDVKVGLFVRKSHFLFYS